MSEVDKLRLLHCQEALRRMRAKSVSKPNQRELDLAERLIGVLPDLIEAIRLIAGDELIDTRAEVAKTAVSKLEVAMKGLA